MDSSASHSEDDHPTKLILNPLKPCEQHPRKNDTGFKMGRLRKALLITHTFCIIYNAVWWAQSYSPDPPLPPPPIHTSSVFSLPAQKNFFLNPPSSATLKIACAAKGETPEGAFYYAYIRTQCCLVDTIVLPQTLHYHHHLSTQHNLFPICMISPPNHPQYIYILLVQ